MNPIFKQWVTSSAFNLSLTEGAIQDLLFMHHCHEDARSHGKDPDEYGHPFTGERTSAGYLMRRGLIEWKGDGYSLTESGRLVCLLLREAGFKHAVPWLRGTQSSIPATAFPHKLGEVNKER